MARYSKFLILNIGTGCGVSVIDLVKTFERVNNISIKFIMGKRRKGDIAISYASPELARLKIKWKSKRDLDKMCIDGWRWYKKINHLV